MDSHLFTWIHLDALDIGREKGNLPGPKREKGKCHGFFWTSISLGKGTAHTHARPTRNDFLVGLIPPTSGILECILPFP